MPSLVEIFITVYIALTTGAIGWLFKTVIDLQSEVKVLKSQREAYLRELDKVDKTLEQILWED